MKSFRELRVWQEAVDLAVDVYKATEQFPRRDHFGLAVQLRRSGVSIPSNVAEGPGRITLRDWRHFLAQARGSLYELETQLAIAVRLGYLDAATEQSLVARASDLGRGLSGLFRYVNGRYLANVRAAMRHGQRTTDNASHDDLNAQALHRRPSARR
jgi:four helix bundle protein